MYLNIMLITKYISYSIYNFFFIKNRNNFILLLKQLNLLKSNNKLQKKNKFYKKSTFT